MKQILVTTTQLNGTRPATSKASALLSKSLSLHHKSHPHLGFQRNHFLVFPYIFITGTEFQNQNFSFDLPMLKCSRVPKSPLTYNSLSSRPCLAPPIFLFITFHFILLKKLGHLSWGLPPACTLVVPFNAPLYLLPMGNGIPRLDENQVQSLWAEHRLCLTIFSIRRHMTTGCLFVTLALLILNT